MNVHSDVEEEELNQQPFNHLIQLSARVGETRWYIPPAWRRKESNIIQLLVKVDCFRERRLLRGCSILNDLSGDDGALVNEAWEPRSGRICYGLFRCRGVKVIIKVTVIKAMGQTKKQTGEAVTMVDCPPYPLPYRRRIWAEMMKSLHLGLNIVG